MKKKTNYQGGDFMKKLAKKMVALVAAMVMVLAMGVVANAATITINPGTPTTGSGDPTYTYYQVLKASVGTAGTSYYVENETLANALDALTVDGKDLFTVTRVGTTSRWNVVLNNKTEATGETAATSFTGAEVAAALNTSSVTSNAIATGTATKNDNGTYKVEITGDGYVLITSSLGTALVADTYTTKTVNEKNVYPTINKTEDKTTAEIGDTITYTVPVTIPATANKAITVTDTISDGLTLNTAITAATTVTGQTVSGLSFTLSSTNETTSAKTYTVEIPAATVTANAGGTITLTYTATLNDNAVVNENESNSAHLSYDNFTTTDVTVNVKTFGFELDKVDGSNNALAGVKLTLTNAAGDYYDPSTANDSFKASTTAIEVTTGTDGKITFKGLNAGTYTLTETETVAGYNKLTAPLTITVGSDGNISVTGYTTTGNVLTVVNQAGTALPSTGGMGTTIFYVVGAALVIGAGVVLVTRRRVQK